MDAKEAKQLVDGSPKLAGLAVVSHKSRSRDATEGELAYGVRFTYYPRAGAASKRIGPLGNHDSKAAAEAAMHQVAYDYLLQHDRQL